MPIQNHLYAFDPSGLLAANRITGEIHTVSAAQGANLSFVVPRCAPFFQNVQLEVRRGNLASSPLMVEGVDYLLTHRFVEASQGTGKQVFGSISFIDRNFTGQVWLKYQTIGGDWTYDDYSIVEVLTNTLYNIYTVTWSQIMGMPVAFPPIAHTHDNDLTGMADVVAKLEQVRLAIEAAATNPAALVNLLNNHLANPNAHTKSQVGLSNVPNWGGATQAEAEAGIVGNAIMTPLRVKQALAVLGAASLLTARNIELVGDVTGNVNFDGSADVDMTTTLGDRFRFYENTLFADITSGVSAIDPNLATQPYFLTKHVNSPDNTGTYHWFILNFSQGTGGGVVRRGQVAVEFGGGTTVIRMAIRGMNSSGVWGAWQFTSNHQDHKVDGRVYGTAYVSALSPGADADINNILDPLCIVHIASTSLDFLPRGKWLLKTYFLNGKLGTTAPATCDRVQVAMRAGDTVVSRAHTWTRTWNATGQWWSRWQQCDVGGDQIFDRDLNQLTQVGTWRQNGIDTPGYDWQAMNYPVHNNGTVHVVGVGNGVTQIFRGAGNHQVFERYATNGNDPNFLAAPTWSTWVEVQSASGGITVDPNTFPVVPVSKGGTGGTDQATGRAGLGLKSGATTQIWVSSTPPVSPSAGDVWLQPIV